MSGELRELVSEHRLAMEDEGYARPADEALWSAVDRAGSAAEVAVAVAGHRAAIGVYPLSVDEELWSQLDMEQRQ